MSNPQVGVQRVFYVYTHAYSDGNVFYVGKGTGSRAYSLKNRNQYHTRIIEKFPDFKISVYPCFDERHALEVEIQLIRCMRKAGLLLANISSGGEGKHGWKHAEETKIKMSAAKRGQPAHNKGGTSWSAGKKHSDTHRKAISDALKGRISSPIGLQRAHDANRGSTPHNKGKKLSPAHIEKLRAAKLGKPLSESHKIAIGVALKSSEKHKTSAQGRTHSDETRQKISEAIKRFRSKDGANKN